MDPRIFVPAVVYVESIAEIETFDNIPSLETGYVLYPEGGSESDGHVR